MVQATTGTLSVTYFCDVMQIGSARNFYSLFEKPRPDVVRLLIIALVATFLVWLPGPRIDSAIASGQQATFIDVQAGASHTLALTTDGIIYSWGLNDKGQLGDGSTTSRSVPARVSDLNFGGLTFSAVAASEYYSLALRNDGKVFAWGNNFNGFLGDGTTVNKESPVQLNTSVTFSAISAGGSFALALTEGGKAYAWGFNSAGQLADGTTARRLSPNPIASALTFSAVATGTDHVLALDSGGALWSWGNGQYGQLGNGSINVTSSQPVLVSSSQFIEVSAGSGFSQAIAASGTLYSWGLNTFGALGLGDQVNRSVPTRVNTSQPLLEVSSGRFHSVAIASSGFMVAFGENGENQLGDGTTVRRLSPISVSTVSSGIRQFTHISIDGAPNGNHSFAIGTDGLLYGWGYNQYGQLGNGTTTNAVRPTALSPIYTGPSANLGPASTTPSSAFVPLTCAGSCGPSNNYSFSANLTLNGQAVDIQSGTASSSTTTLSFVGLSANKTYTLEVSVSYNGLASQVTTTTVTTPKPTATISALTVTDTSATMAVGCINCGAFPDSFTVSATPVAGGTAITSNTTVISGLTSETTYSFSVVVAFAGTNSNVVLWRNNSVMTLPFVPVIAAVSPAALPLAGGNVTVSGSNFTTSSLLSLNGMTRSFTIVDGNTITFAAQNLTPGSYHLAITNPVGTFTFSNAITYFAGPTLATNSPVLATTNGGTIVTLTGTNLAITNQVNVGATTVSFSVITDTMVRFTTRATTSGIAAISLVTVGGVATLSNAIEFTSSALTPVIGSITPSTGPFGGGTVITVTGMHFSGSYSSAVSAAINGVSGSSILLVDDSTLTFVSPPGAASTGLDVSVATGGGLGRLIGAFSYTAPPQQAQSNPNVAASVAVATPMITEFSTRSIAKTGAQVTATGQNLLGISVLTLGGVTLTIISNTATSITFTTGEMPVGVWDLRLVGPNGTLVFMQAIEVVAATAIISKSTGKLLGYAWTLKFIGNSRFIHDAQAAHLTRRFNLNADTIVCWGYVTASSPNAWAIAHARQRAQAACDLVVANNPAVKTSVRLRFGVEKSWAMRSSLQFWELKATN